MNSRENLSHLPLHDVTRLYSADGLEARFTEEVAALNLPPEDHARIQDALGLAVAAHATQMRGEHPYATHILRVATRIIHHFGVQDPAIIIAALLHDGVEDQPGRLLSYEVDDPESPTHKPAALEAVRNRFGDEVAELVDAVTNPEFDETGDKQAQYREHVVVSMTDNPKARVIKLSDFLDNCSGLKYNEDPVRARRLAGKYQPLIPAMRHFALLPDTPLPETARAYILERLDRASERCDTLLAA